MITFFNEKEEETYLDFLNGACILKYLPRDYHADWYVLYCYGGKMYRYSNDSFEYTYIGVVDFPSKWEKEAAVVVFDVISDTSIEYFDLEKEFKKIKKKCREGYYLSLGENNYYITDKVKYTSHEDGTFDIDNFVLDLLTDSGMFYLKIISDERLSPVNEVKEVDSDDEMIEKLFGINT